MNTCSEIMTQNIECCVPSTTVDQVAKLMKFKYVGPIPIVENLRTKKLLGIVTDRDLVLKVLGDSHDPKTTKVEDVMTHRPITCGPDDSVDEALKLMERHQVRRLPIVNQFSQLIGIISEADIATRFKQPGKTAALVEAVSKAKAASTR